MVGLADEGLMRILAAAALAIVLFTWVRASACRRPLRLDRTVPERRHCAALRADRGGSGTLSGSGWRTRCDRVVGSPKAPYENEHLARECGVAARYSGITDPSLPNYIGRS
jgi:hypothetical protein